MNLPFEALKRKILVKQEASTDPTFGKKPSDRTADELMKSGIVVIDKPSGPTSHQVSANVKQILHIKKTGHSGTLDPAVTGVLPVALDTGTRIVESLLSAGKEYVCVMHLHQPVEEKIVKKELQKYIGKIHQLPPVRSAVKRQWRYRKVYYVEFLEMKEQDVLFKIGCQAGTYIRKYVHDLGKKLGVGAHMKELRRTKAGPFKEDSLVTLYDLKDALHYYTEEGKDTELKKVIQPLENAIAHIGKIWVLDSSVDAICHGASLKVPGIAKLESEIQADEPVALLTLKGELIATAKSAMNSKTMLKESKGVAARLEQVFMQRGTYPKIKK